jgi:uncharacterized membrane protein YczE
MKEFSEPIICALCGLVFLAFGASFLAGASLGIAGFASLCKAAEVSRDT